ncbi:hypothetical protein ACLBWT_19665 [Paenibacillus sp. D51F]
MTAPLIAFIGTTPNIGTTAAAYAAACRIAEQTGGEVGFLCLNLKSAKIHRYLGSDAPAHTLDAIRPELKSRSLTPRMLRRACWPSPDEPGVHALFGNLLRDQAEYFTPEEAEHLLETAALTFSAVVADAGCYWDNAATISAARRADSRVLCTTGALSHFQEDCSRWIRQVSPLFGVDPSRYELLPIHSPWRTGGYKMKEIGKETGLPLIGSFQTNEAFYDSLDHGRYGHWLKKDAAGTQVMSGPAETLVNRHGLRQRPAVESQPWYRRLRAHRGELGV